MGASLYNYDELKPISSKEELEAFEKQSDESFKARQEEFDRLAEEERVREQEAEEQRVADENGSKELYNSALSDRDITLEER